MEKCNLCIDRLEKEKQAICVDACPVYALDVDTIEKIKKKYERSLASEGFKYSDKIKP